MKTSPATTRILASVSCLCCVALVLPGSARASESSGKKGAPSKPVILWKGGTRIPSIDITPKGTLLVFAQHGGGDNHPNIIEMRRSTDGGRTWSAAKALTADKSGRANPSSIVDKKTGIVWVFWSDRTKGIYRLCYCCSRDDGLTWSKAQPLKIDDSLVVGLPSCNRGIQLSTGRLLLPFTVPQPNSGRYRRRCPRTVYSDDGGKTWQLGKLPVPMSPWKHVGSSEYHCFELADGRIYMNHRKGGSRLAAHSGDGGVSWSKPFNSGLRESKHCNGCHAGLVRLTHPKRDDKSRLLFSSTAPLGNEKDPAKFDRRNLTLFISYDEGKTWKKLKSIWKDRAAYSNLIVLPDKTIGCIYETHKPSWQSVLFTRFRLEWLTDGKDKVKPATGN